jgi:hypothetical protein
MIIPFSAPDRAVRREYPRRVVRAEPSLCAPTKRPRALTVHERFGHALAETKVVAANPSAFDPVTRAAVAGWFWSASIPLRVVRDDDGE